jgi:hypothetical protein
MAHECIFVSMILGIKVASVWIVGLLGGCLLRALLPSNWFIFTTRASAGYVYPVNRVAFWACLIAASLVTTAWVIRLCLQDLHIR